MASTRKLLLLLVLSLAAADPQNQVHVQSSQGDTGAVAQARRLAEVKELAAPYTGHQVIKVYSTGNETVSLLQQFEEAPGFDFWTPPQASTVDIMVSPESRGRLTNLLNSQGISYSVSIPDVARSIEEENSLPSDYYLEQLQSRQGHRMTFDSYHRLADHHAYMRHIGSSYGGLCKTISIGTSYEGRDIMGVQCGLGKREIFIDGGIHAREWISPATVSYLIREFSEMSFSKQSLLKAFKITIVPILNPDGYEYTHTGRRMWRKTRSRNAGSRCIGVDPNRNFDVHWGQTGSSTNPCSDIYAGPRAFSEKETQAVKKYLMARRRTMEMYISFHSYSQMLFVPYAYSKYEKPADYSELERVAKKGAQALLQAGGVSFQVGTASQLLYEAAGGSDDWAKKEAGIKYSYTFELRDKGRYGFTLPAQYIEQSGKETTAAVVAMIQAIL